MRIPKLLTMICVTALLGGTSAKADREDSESQAKAREVTRHTVDHLNEIGAPTVAPYYTSKEAGEAHEMPPKMGSTEPTRPGAWLNGEDELKARMAVRAAVAENNAKAGVVDPETLIWAKRLQDAEAARTEVALHKAEAEQDAMKHTHPRPAPAQVAAPEPMKTPPPTLAPGSKEQRLADLLLLYKADKITPAEYHQQRAKIVAEP